ncbi:MAG: hypothetical protein ACI85N_001844 [Gammaproteobacteria bacterium]|jgi:hypothetical protein
MNNAERTLIIYSREDCCLCHEMRDALKPWQNQYNFKVEIIDIEHDSELTERFAARIPLLAEGDKEICQYHLEEQMLLNHFKDAV